MGSRALVADSKETWVCSYLSLALLIGVGAFAAFGWWWADSLATALLVLDRCPRSEVILRVCCADTARMP
jgi:hypothetical protein